MDPQGELYTALYGDLKRLAHGRLRQLPGGGLNTTALVHESFLRLDGRELHFSHEGQFLAYAAKVMRSVLVDLAREQGAERRGSGLAPLTLATEALLHIAQEPPLLEVHEALQSLEALEPRLAQVVEMRYFAGLSEAEIGAALGLAERSVRRDWVKARALLRSMLVE